MFLQRYKILLLKVRVNHKRGKIRQLKELVVLIARQVVEIQKLDNIQDSEGELRSFSAGIQIGRSKVFLKTWAFECLERLRQKKLALPLIQIQAAMRRFSARCFLKRVMKAVITVQSIARRCDAMAKVEAFRSCNRARNVIILWFQKMTRARIERDKIAQLKRVYKSIMIQSWWRQHFARHFFALCRRSAIYIQCCIRSYTSLKRLRKLKRGALERVTAERIQLSKDVKELKLCLEDMRVQIKKEANGSTVVLMNEKNDREAMTIKLTNEINLLKSKCVNVSTQAKLDKEKIQLSFDDYRASTEAGDLQDNHKEGELLPIHLQKEWKDKTELMDELNSFATELIRMDQELNEKNNVLCMYKSLAEQAFQESADLSTKLKRTEAEAEMFATEIVTFSQETEDSCSSLSNYKIWSEQSSNEAAAATAQAKLYADMVISLLGKEDDSDAKLAMCNLFAGKEVDESKKYFMLAILEHREDCTRASEKLNEQEREIKELKTIIKNRNMIVDKNYGTLGSGMEFHEKRTKMGLKLVPQSEDVLRDKDEERERDSNQLRNEEFSRDKTQSSRLKPSSKDRGRGRKRNRGIKNVAVGERALSSKDKNGLPPRIANVKLRILLAETLPLGMKEI